MRQKLTPVQKQEKKQGRFSKIMVVYCILFLTVLIVAGMLIQYLTGEDTSGIIAIAAGVFGGELCLLCLKRILAKPSQKGETPYGDDEDSSEEGC